MRGCTFCGDYFIHKDYLGGTWGMHKGKQETCTKCKLKNLKKKDNSEGYT